MEPINETDGGTHAAPSNQCEQKRRAFLRSVSETVKRKGRRKRRRSGALEHLLIQLADSVSRGELSITE